MRSTCLQAVLNSVSRLIADAGLERFEYFRFRAALDGDDEREGELLHIGVVKGGELGLFLRRQRVKPGGRLFRRRIQR